MYGTHTTKKYVQQDQHTKVHTVVNIQFVAEMMSTSRADGMTGCVSRRRRPVQAMEHMETDGIAQRTPC